MNDSSQKQNKKTPHFISNIAYLYLFFYLCCFHSLKINRMMLLAMQRKCALIWQILFQLLIKQCFIFDMLMDDDKKHNFPQEIYKESSLSSNQTGMSSEISLKATKTNVEQRSKNCFLQDIDVRCTSLGGYVTLTEFHFYTVHYIYWFSFTQKQDFKEENLRSTIIQIK